MQSKNCHAFFTCKRFNVKAITFAISLFLFISSSLTAQQPDKPVYVSVLYVKVNPGMGAKYNELLNNYTKKVNEQHLKAGRIMGWYVHNVILPTGSNAAYDMTIVTVSDNLGFLLDDSVGYRNWLKQAMINATDQSLGEIITALGAARAVVKKEIFTYIDGININSNPSKYVQVDFMRSTPGKENEYVKTEKETFKPIHAEFVKQGKRDEWGLYSLDMPYSETGNYNFITANFFSNLNQLNSGNYEEAFKKIFPNKDITTVWTNMNGLRKIVRSELWKLNVYVDATNTKK
jgi:hypothetical protein